MTKDFTFQTAAGATVVPGSSDKIRAVIGRAGQTAVLTISSDADTAAGSYFHKNTPSSGKNRLRLDASDLTFDAGVYTLSVEYYEAADAAEWKQVSRHVFNLVDT